MADTVSELLPCPFCGGEAEFVGGADDDGQWVAIGCPDCGAGSRQHYAVMEDPHPHAQSAWNTRASTHPAPAFPRDKLADIADRIERQAKCLEGYAEQSGHPAKPVPSVFHFQASHFRDLAKELSALLQGKQP